jgi:glycosidase
MTYLGAPMIYYGDEAGMWGADDPDDRKPMVWPDLRYDNEATHPLPARTRTDDEVKFDNELFQYYQSLIRIRNEHEALRRGDFKTILADDARQVFGFERSMEGSRVIVLINTSGEHQDVSIPLGGRWRCRELLTGDSLEGSGALQYSLKPRSGAIFCRER